MSPARTDTQERAGVLPLELVTDPARIAAGIRQVRQNAKTFLTNFYIGPSMLASWVAKGEVSCLSADRCFWIQRQDRDFFHLYYFAPDAAGVSAGLDEISRISPDVPRVVDLVGRPSEVREAEQPFRSSGFVPYAGLIRMLRRSGSGEGEVASSQVTYARHEQAVAVLGMLERHFDPLAKQVPSIDEVRDAIERQGVLVVSKDEHLVGLLLFETAGASATLRYWCVETSARGTGVGNALLSAFLENHCAGKAVSLWVLDDNSAAIRQYSRQGFQPDGRCATVLVNEPALHLAQADA